MDVGGDDIVFRQQFHLNYLIGVNGHCCSSSFAEQNQAFDGCVSGKQDVKIVRNREGNRERKKWIFN